MSLEHDCISCRHHCVDFFEPPCCECYFHPDKDPDKWEPQITRHYDRIINKTPEELAEWIAGIYPDCPPGFSPAPLGCDDVCAECWLEWLKGEAEPC